MPSESAQDSLARIASRADQEAHRRQSTEVAGRSAYVRKALSDIGFAIRVAYQHRATTIANARPRDSRTQENPLADHKFKVGQTVDFSPGRHGMPAMSRLYKVVKLLPPEAGQLLYRIKGTSEPFERVARERELSRP
jgi:predicted RNA-binding protein YlxR (DUF448 family)